MSSVRKLCPECERPLVFDPRYEPLNDGGLEVANATAKCPVCGWQGRFGHGLTEPRIPSPRPEMPYVSIDIETTGLDDSFCQILEIGAVFDDWTLKIDALPTFHCYVVHERIVGQPFGLAMNSKLLYRLANPPVLNEWSANNDLRPGDVARDMAAWLQICGWDTKKAITPAGKNFASFDRGFLKLLPGFEDSVRLHHRTMDPAPLYFMPGDTKLPDSKTCYERAGMDGKVAHTALEDALAVVRLIRTGIKRLGAFR